MKQNFLRAETLITANALLVAAHNKVPLTQAWRGGEAASADGLRFTVPVWTIHAGPNPQYFGRERGVTWYNLLSERYTGLNSVTVPGTLHDSLYLLAVVLEQETELQPVENMTDRGHWRRERRRTGPIRSSMPPRFLGVELLAKPLKLVERRGAVGITGVAERQQVAGPHPAVRTDLVERDLALLQHRHQKRA